MLDSSSIRPDPMTAHPIVSVAPGERSASLVNRRVVAQLDPTPPT